MPAEWRDKFQTGSRTMPSAFAGNRSKYREVLLQPRPSMPQSCTLCQVRAEVNALLVRGMAEMVAAPANTCRKLLREIDMGGEVGVIGFVKWVI